MINRLSFLLFTAFLITCELSAQTPKRVVGYIMNARLARDKPEIDVKKLTHINYAFADVKDGKVVEIRRSDQANLAYLNTLKKDNPELKLLISVGGWTRSGGFSDAALTEESREIFATSAVEYMQRHKLDGIDLDWEYPGQVGDGNKFRAEDKENFTAVLKLLRQKLDILGAEDEVHYLLTIASAASQKYLDRVEMREISQVLDFINIMAYDYFGAWSTTTGNHTNFPRSMEAVERHIKAGAPAEKLTLGVAFYGKGWRKVVGMHEPASKEAFSMNYHEIKDSIGSGYEERWDSMSMSPYAYNSHSESLIAYDSPRSLRLKARFVKDQKMGGVMFWEYSGDDEGVLLSTIHDEFHTIPGHSHNDYENANPLEEALEAGLRSIEVDVHLKEDELYVSHNRPRSLDPSRTLEKLYLQPLASAEFSQQPLYLLIDVKTDALQTYHKLYSLLKDYQHPNVKYIISGNRAIDEILADESQLMLLDGRPDDLQRGISATKMPLISQNYRKFFSSRKVGNIDAKEKKSFQKFLAEAHSQGIKVRLWASPDEPSMWQFLMDLGVDLINTDRPAELAKWFTQD